MSKKRSITGRGKRQGKVRRRAETDRRRWRKWTEDLMEELKDIRKELE